MKQLSMRILARLGVAAALATGPGFGVAAQAEGPALKRGHEYMVVANYPNNLHVLELAGDSLYKSCPLPRAFGPGTIQMAPDGHTAYILNNHYEDIYGVDLDSCELVFHAAMSQAPNERAKSMFSFAVSPDGDELYAVQNPTLIHRDHYRVQAPRLAVYDTAAGLDAKPVRTFEAPRQITVMQTGADGSLYLAGPDIYKMDVESGAVEVAVPSRNWQRPNYTPPDVLSVWPIQTATRDFTVLYTTARFRDETQNPETADWLWGYMNVDLESGETETRDFGPITEVYFTGTRSPKNPNLMYGVLNRLTKYDIEKQTLLQAAELDHSYYCIAINRDASKIYLAGTFNDIAIYDADSLEKLGAVELPGGDMAISTAQIFVR
ncbi:quinohemoprotein amine dehydrogenase subunit beta [Marinobacterium aestuariivivens]|uniref:Quinohemoprotein amine dehydrogenase subunit beta n=1 Tax=Marinobacterium aestuariivivens TaxID=1698799 RepID=A0ABW2A6A6_9GAMM